MCEIEKYNNKLILSKEIISIVEYVKNINKLKYNIDIDFIDEFIELVNKDECCIHHENLQKYGVCTLNSTTGDINKILVRNKFIENEDYLLGKVSQQLSSGTKYKNVYNLHPRAFKICLMRSTKTIKYAKYYLLLEECIKHYNDYQIQLKDKYSIILENKIKEKDNKINNLEDKLDNIILSNKEIVNKLEINNLNLLNKHDILLLENKDMKTILEKNQLKLDKTFDKLVGMNEKLKDVKDKLDDTNEELKDVKDKLDDTNEELRDVNDKLEDTNEELFIIKDKLDIATDDRVVKTKSKTTLEYLIILKTEDVLEDYKYYIIRCQKRSIKQRLEDNQNYKEIKRIECVPNSTNLYNRIKEELKSNLKFKSNRVNLINLSELEFLNKIDLINEEKKII